MIILAKQTGRERFNRLFKERTDNQAPATTRRAGGPGPDMLAAILAETAEQTDFDHLEEGWLAPPEEHNLNQAAIAKLNDLLQGGHNAS